MDYALAKKLKDSGFPQNNREGDIVSDNLLREDEAGSHMNSAYVPTLSELIEACGKSLDMLVRQRDGIKNNTLGWTAYCHKDSRKSISCDGTTPEIAVAELWLKLQ